MSAEQEASVQNPGAHVLSLKDAAKARPQPASLPEVTGRKTSDDASAPAGQGVADRSDSAVKGNSRRRARLIALGALLGGTILAAGFVYWDYAEHFESTDDAFIAARQFIVAPRVAGYITQVAVTDNQHVNVGDVIARIDDRDFRVALALAEAQVASATAAIQQIDAQIAVQQAQVDANRAQVDQAQAALTFAQQQYARYKDLADSQVGTVEMAQQTESTLRQNQATLTNTKAALVASQRQIDTLKAQRSVAEANLAQAEAQRDQARLNLSYTMVTAGAG